MVGGWGGEEKGATKGSSGSVRGLSCPNCKPNSTIIMSALGVGQKGESQKFLFCRHCFRGRIDRKRTAQGEFKGKGEMEMQEWNLHKKGAACVSAGLQRETPVPVKL